MAKIRHVLHVLYLCNLSNHVVTSHLLIASLCPESSAADSPSQHIHVQQCVCACVCQESQGCLLWAVIHILASPGCSCSDAVFNKGLERGE